jgi:hypothetical protein
MSFWADRWRFAAAKTWPRLRAAYNSYVANAIVITSAFVVGVLLFGYSYWAANIQAAAATLIALAGIFALSLILIALVFAFDYARAPSAMWLRDQQTIKDLRERLRPRICLSFSESECVKTLREGRVSHSVAGTRFHDTKSGKTHYLIKCSSRGAAPVNVEAYVTSVKHRYSQSLPVVDKIFEPVRLDSQWPLNCCKLISPASLVL